MKPKTLPLVALCFILCTLPAGAADWPGFRGPGGLAVAEDKELPTTWDGTKNLVWKVKLPGPGGSSPITLGDRVFVTCYSGYGAGEDGEQADLRRHLICVDKKTGEIKWDKAVKAATPETEYNAQGFIGRHGYASSTPATDGQRVYAFFGKTGVFAFDLDGKQLWKAKVGTDTHDWGSAPSPVPYKDLVIVNAGVESGSLIALRKKDGEQAWKYGGIDSSWGTPVLVDVKGGKQELVLSMQGKVIGVDPESGKELWKCDGIHDYVCPSVVAKDGIV